MRALSFEPEHHRLRVAGRCGDDDVRQIQEAVGSHARSASALIVDLTAVTEVSAGVARALVAARSAADGCRVTLVRKSDSAVDRSLRQSERETSRRQAVVSRRTTRPSSAGAGTHHSG